jgi:hypothetical protein
LLQVRRPLGPLKVMDNRPVHTVGAPASVPRIRHQTIDRLGARAALSFMKLLDICARWHTPA